MASSGRFYMIEMKNEEEYKAVSEYIGKIVLDDVTFTFLRRSNYDPEYAMFILGLNGKRSRRIKKEIENLLNTMREG